MEGQNKIDSFLESLTNLIVGFLIAILSQLMIFPVMQKDFTLQENFILTSFFTVVSFLRTYSIRRIFNGKSIYQFIKTWRKR